MQTLSIGLLGLGTVGTGLVNLLHDNASEITRRSGCVVSLHKAAVRDVNKTRACPSVDVIADAHALVDDPAIDVVVELIGGDTLAFELVSRAIANGKHVVTANKALIAKHGMQLCVAAQAQGVHLAFEAAVAGCIPVLKALREGLAANKIQWLAGIVNGTSNFILTRMVVHGDEFSSALALAQNLGYAEADPTFDVEGIDAAHKLTILASLAFGIPLQMDGIYCEGIAHITAADIQYISEMGYCIKHLAIAQKTTEGVSLRVHPTLLPKEHILAHVNDAMNAVFIQADAAGPTLYYGQGAGALPTASAVAADILEIVHARDNIRSLAPSLAFPTSAVHALPLAPMGAIETVYYLRLYLRDEAGALAEITQILGRLSISIEVLLQKASHAEQAFVPVVILTHVASEANVQQAIAQIQALSSVRGEVVCLRTETLLDKVQS